MYPTATALGLLPPHACRMAARALTVISRSDISLRLASDTTGSHLYDGIHSAYTVPR